MTSALEPKISNFSRPLASSNLTWLFSRESLRWKSWFYKGLLPMLARCGPVRAGEHLERLGNLSHDCFPSRKRLLKETIPVDVFRKNSGRTPDEIVRGLSGQMLRYVARDCVLNWSTPDSWGDLFVVEGLEYVQQLIENRRGAIILGSHLGGHLAAVHWMIAQGLPLRMLVQRPRNVSVRLNDWFDQDHPICPQRDLFLKRDLNPKEASRRMMDVRRLILKGVSVYTNCDIMWSGPNTDTCRFLGQQLRFQSIWIDLAMILECPVISVECRQIPGGRFRLRFDAPVFIQTNESRESIFDRTISRLENAIIDYPNDAVAHLTWSHFRPGRHTDPKSDRPESIRRPSQIRTEDTKPSTKL